MAKSKTHDTAAAGFAVAGFFLSMNMLTSSVRRGAISTDEAREIIARAATILPDFPGGADVIDFARQMLGVALQAVDHAATERASDPTQH